jgi:hypothetical protein
VRNDPNAAAIVMRLVDMLVGACVRLSPQPGGAALGLDPENAADAAVLQELQCTGRLEPTRPPRLKERRRKV